MVKLLDFHPANPASNPAVTHMTSGGPSGFNYTAR